jgi:hypothetical protein
MNRTLVTVPVERVENAILFIRGQKVMLDRDNIAVMRTFVRLRQMLISNAGLARKLEQLEKKYDHQFKVVFDAIRQLMIPPEPKRKQIGFHTKSVKR